MVIFVADKMLTKIATKQKDKKIALIIIKIIGQMSQ